MDDFATPPNAPGAASATEPDAVLLPATGEVADANQSGSADLTTEYTDTTDMFVAGELPNDAGTSFSPTDVARSPWAPPLPNSTLTSGTVETSPYAPWSRDDTFTSSVGTSVPTSSVASLGESTASTPSAAPGWSTAKTPSFPSSDAKRAPEFSEPTTARGDSPSAPPSPTNSATRRSWLRPAMIGGVVGALVSSAVLGTALVTTRNDNNSSSSQITTSVTTPTLPELANVQALPGEGVPGVLAKIQPSVVTIATKGFDQNFGAFNAEPQEGAGTGIVLTADGYILTNAHVIANAASIKVAFPGDNGRKVMSANVVGRDRANDVAIVKIDGVKDLIPAKLGSSAKMRVGESVVAVGNALGLPGGSTVTTGIISAVDRTIEGDGEKLSGLLQTDAAINPGNSGGPLVNGNGEVIGMNTAIIQNSNNIGFAIAIDRIKPIVERIKKGDASTKPRTFLGVSTQTMDAAIRDQYGLSTDKGALVVDVTVGSPADNLGLQAGDIITKFDGKEVASNKVLSDTVQKKKVGERVEVEWKRGTQTVKGIAILGSARTLQSG